MKKICAKCKIEKDYSEYSKLSRASDGLNYRCKVCCSEYYSTIYNRIKDKKILYQKERYLLKRDDILIKQKIRYNSEEKKKYNRQYNLLNKDKINFKKNVYEKNRYANDLNYKLIKNMRKIVHRLVNNKKDSTFNILGYNQNTLLNYLGKYPNSNEHLDHKIPVSWFIVDAPINIVSHYKNLQILSKEENFKKSNNYSDIVDYDYYLLSITFIKPQFKTKIKHNGN
jgi:hypothetical protein